MLQKFKSKLYLQASLYSLDSVCQTQTDVFIANAVS